MKEKKARGRGRAATRRALRSRKGIVPGGGVRPRAARLPRWILLTGETEGETTGVRIVRRALEEPLRQIADNAGHEGAVSCREIVCRWQRRRVRIQYAQTEEYGGPRVHGRHRPNQGRAHRAQQCR